MTPPWPMPQDAYVPGLTRRPNRSPAFDAAKAAPPVTDPLMWHRNASYLYGLDLHAGGCFWEAHEVWEAVWSNARPNSPERRVCEALIQISNACLKLRMGRPGAASRLLGMSAALARDLGQKSVMGLRPGALIADALALRGRIDAGYRPVTGAETEIWWPVHVLEI